MKLLSLPVICFVLACLWRVDSARPVSNEDIRDAIISIVHMIRASEDKLERHEYRERNLGDQLKKSLLTLDKRLKLLDPVKGTISRLDERLATVETILMQKDERERIQLQKTFDTVEDIQKNLPNIMEKMKQDILEKLSNQPASQAPGSPASGSTLSSDLKAFQNELNKKLDAVSNSIGNLEKQLGKLREDNNNLNGKSTETLEKVKRQLNESESLLGKYENKLAEMNNKIPLLGQSSSSEQKDWQVKFLQALDIQKSNVEHILSDMKDVSSKIEKLPEKRDIESIHNETLSSLERVKENSKSTQTPDLIDEKLKDLKKDVNDKHKILYENLVDIEKIVKNIEGGFGKTLNNLKEEILHVPSVDKNDIEQILSDIKTVSNKIEELPDKNDMEAVRKETFNKLDHLNFNGYNTELQPMVQDSSFETIDQKLKQLRQDSNEKHRELMETLKDMNNNTHVLTDRFGKGYLQLLDGIEELGKLEQVLIQTDDSVRDTKRRVEYGVHQVVGEVGELVKKYVKDINATINERFDNFEVDMFGEESGALANFTWKIGKEIDKVWRQIGIMHQQMSSSADTLTVLLNHTDHYVNNSMNLMDGMKGKVGTITGKMLEVDDNLNFLLGKLHLVTQEFNQIRGELGKVLDDIKNNFKKVKGKVEDMGPGPHKIESSQLDTIK